MLNCGTKTPFDKRRIKVDFPTDASPIKITLYVLSGGPVASVITGSGFWHSMIEASFTLSMIESSFTSAPKFDPSGCIQLVDTDFLITILLIGESCNDLGKCKSSLVKDNPLSSSSSQLNLFLRPAAGGHEANDLCDTETASSSVE